ncbi:MAG: CysS/YqeB C-terminal domain-containing protein [Actinomycetota bacterium]
MSLLVLMGSGETAPPMVRTHREIFEEVGPGPAVLLDTPFAFQMNVDDLTARTRAYFSRTVGRELEVARWRRADAPVAEREAALAALERSRWAFAGPGSPTYALRQWLGTPVPAALAAVAERGGAVVAGSAAAVTVGTHAVPVYEIYKAGLEPAWAEGLDLLGTLAGIRAAVVPHFDNAEGGTHDTRYCYLGETRLARLEATLPDEVGVLGVDEHTALLIDLDSGAARVRGAGAVTVRRRGIHRAFAAGQEIAVDELAGLLTGRDRDAAGVPAAPQGVAAATTEAAVAPAATRRTNAGAAPAQGAGGRHAGTDAATDGQPAAPPSLRAEAEAARVAFDRALAAGDADGCVTAILELEDAIAAWATDMLESDDADRARRVLRAMVVELGTLAREGARDPREVLGPYLDLLLTVRAEARAAGRYDEADRLRQRLVALGVEIRDGRDATSWHLPGRGERGG